MEYRFRDHGMSSAGEQQEREQLSSPADPHCHVIPASGLCSEPLKP